MDMRNEQSEKITNAMDLVVTMTVSEIAEDMNISTSEALARFLKSKIGKMVYDDSTKTWWDGPSYLAEAFEKEIGWNNTNNTD